MRSGRPKVLIFIDHFLPGYKAGGPVRSCANMIDRLKGQYRFEVVTRDREYLEETPFQEVESDAWNERDAYRVYYASEASLSMQMIRERILEVQPDTVYINGIYSYCFSILPLRVLQKMEDSARVVVAPRGMLAPGAMRIKPFKKRAFLLFARMFGLFKGVAFHATTEQEVKEIRRWIGDREIRVAPNLPPAVDPSKDPGVEKEAGSLRLISIARIAPEKNTLGLLRELKEFGSPGIRLDLYGPIYDGAYWNRCKKQIEEMPEGMEVLQHDGISPDRAAEVLRSAHAFLLLTYGENFGHAILEALLAGRPVIISDRTPWKDLEKEGVGWVIGPDDRSSFQNCLQELLQMEAEEYEGLLERVQTYGRELQNKAGQEGAYHQILNG